GIDIPVLCHDERYDPVGVCRMCVVDTGGRVFAAACVRPCEDGMEIRTTGEELERSRAVLTELLVADQPPRAEDPKQTTTGDNLLLMLADGFDVSRESTDLPCGSGRGTDSSNPVIDVNHDACILCDRCVRACDDIQGNDVIGRSGKGYATRIAFDLNDPMGASSCVTCGECVQACPTGALMEANLLDDAGKRVEYEDRSVDTLCPFCGVGCQTTVHVKDDKILYVDGRDGPANENRLCVKGRFGYDYISPPDRLTKPLIRREGVPKDANMQLRPADFAKVFREVTWEEALEKAAQGLLNIRNEKGGSALAGFGSAKGSNEEAYLFQKIVRQGFETNNVDHCTRLCHASSVAALMESVNSGAVTAPFMAAEDADCMIVIGARPAQNHPVAATYLKNAAARGAKLIIMDPRGHSGSLARHASHMLQFKGGSDVALLNAMLNVIVTEGLVDIQYVQAHTEGYQALEKKIQEYTPEKMEPVCGIPADTIREVARLYATSQRSIIFWGMGISQHTNGTNNARCLISLALITGQIGRPGTGLHPLRGQNNVQGASDAGMIPMVFPDYISVTDDATRAKYEKLWGTKLDPKPGLTVVEIMHAIHKGKINGMYIMGENPAMSDPDVQHAREAIAMLDHLVVQDLFITETAWHADVILPSSAHAEKLGTFTNTNRQVQLGRPVVPLPGEARQDWELIQELAQRMGLDWDYEDVGEVFTEMASVMPSLDNISWERVSREGSVTYPSDAPDKPGNEIIFSSSFPTKSGRAKITPADVLPPDEVPDDEYPL
ncbi:MAG: molybdopterin-dependent oxidoreductase, partial [Actinomycetia bacterium]|nr:molybdopterin-dependent oxidoreductase [Actinomycetes bacterium]